MSSVSSTLLVGLNLPPVLHPVRSAGPVNEPISKEPEVVAQRAFDTSKPHSDDIEALSAMQALQRRLFGVDPVRPHVGRYEIVGRVGEGAMGVVYEARDPKLDRRVALKVLKGRSEDPEQQRNEHERLREEATTLAKLSHANIVEIYDVGRADGRSYIAMEYVDGLDLAQWVAAEPRDWRVIVDVFVQVGRGLAAAHDEGMIHRDIKPSNILVGEDGRVRVADFGLAAPRHVDNPRSVATGANPMEALSTEQSRPSPIMGTVGYMAPEQLLGDRIDQRADIYGMCVALWEALYGTRPLPASSGSRTVAHRRGGGRPATPRGADTPRWLRRVCRRGLAYRRFDRWPSADALAVALERGHQRSVRFKALAVTVVLAFAFAVMWWGGLWLAARGG